MRFAVVGGDDRAVRLACRLLRDGHKVRSFALEQAALPGEIPRDSCLQSCVYGADGVLLPMPAEKGGYLNAPLSAEQLPMPALIEALWPGQLLIGGRFSDRSVRQALQADLRVEDLLHRPDLAVANAALTAEGALGKLIAHSPRALWGSRCLVLGWGRIGQILALRLRDLGARVTVAARNGRDRAMAEALGCRGVDFGALESLLGEQGFLVNTVPARVLSEGLLCLIPPEALLLELASPPGGFDRSLAENLGLQVLAAPGLPGEASPETAAALLQQAVYAALEEQED